MLNLNIYNVLLLYLCVAAVSLYVKALGYHQWIWYSIPPSWVRVESQLHAALIMSSFVIKIEIDYIFGLYDQAFKLNLQNFK